MESGSKRRLSRTGMIITAIYVTLFVAVYVFIALTTKPDNVGYDWIPVILLAMPWTVAGQNLLFPGVILNAAILYLAGTMISVLRGTAHKRVD